MSTGVEIEYVTLLGRLNPRIEDCALASPQAGESAPELALEIKGSVAGSDSPVEAVELTCEGELVRVVDLANDERAPDVKSRGPVRRRFQITLGALRLPPRFTLLVRARLADGTTTAIAEIGGRRESLAQSRRAGDLRACFVTTPSGRTGTTWLVHLLGHHPQIVAYPPHGVEPRVASYWLEVLTALGEPGSYKRILRTSIDRERWWLGEWPEAGRQPIHDEWTRRYLGRDRTFALAGHIHDQIEDFYRGLAGRQGKPEVELFVEKAPMGRLRLEVLGDLLPGAKDVTLFRDPRDTLCSILSYAEKNPNANLVTDRPDAGEEYMQVLAASFAGLLNEARERHGESLVVRYEDLILAPDLTLSRILAHLSLDAGEDAITETLSAAQETTGHLDGHRTAAGNVEASIGRWRRDMEPTLQLRATKVFAEVLADLDYVDNLGSGPGKPARAPDPDAERTSGLVRAVDYRRWRHRYAVGAPPELSDWASSGEITELGALWARPGAQLLALRCNWDGFLETDEYEPAPTPDAEGGRLRWATAPFGWEEAGGFGVRTRRVAGRLRRLLSRPWRPSPSEAVEEVIGYLHRKPGAGRRGLFSSIHPVTGDQLLTTRPREARDLGYGEPVRLGFIDAVAPLTGKLAAKREFVPWAYRFGVWRSRNTASQGALLEPDKPSVSRDALRVRGWAVLRGEPVARVEVKVAGTTVGRARLGLQRPQVRGEANPEAVISGFDLRVPPSKLPAGVGRTRIEAVVSGVRGSRLELSLPDEIELTEPSVPVSDAGLRRASATAQPPWQVEGANHGTSSTEPLRVVAFAHSLAPGGAQRTLFEQVNRLTARGECTARVAASKRGPWADRFEGIGVPVQIADRGEADSAEAYEQHVAELAEILEREAADVVLANTVDSFAGADAATRLGLPVAWIIHESYEFPVWWRMNHPGPRQDHARERCLEALHSAAATIFPANATRVLYTPYVRAERSLTAPCGVEFAQIDEFRSQSDSLKARRSLGLDPNRRVLYTLGIAEPRKGNAVLARAWSLVSRDHPDASLYMVGARETPYCEAIKRYIDSAGISDSCALLPSTVDPLSWHQAADLFVLSSDVESAPIALAEAMAFENPVVATRVFGVPEMISDGIDGILYEPNDVAELATTLDAVLRMNPENLRTIGARGEQRVRVHHDPERFIDRLSEVLRAISNERALASV